MITDIWISGSMVRVSARARRVVGSIPHQGHVLELQVHNLGMYGRQPLSHQCFSVSHSSFSFPPSLSFSQNKLGEKNPQVRINKTKKICQHPCSRIHVQECYKYIQESQNELHRISQDKLYLKIEILDLQSIILKKKTDWVGLSAYWK